MSTRSTRSSRDRGSCRGSIFQGCTRLAVKLDFIVGLLLKALDAMRRRLPRRANPGRRCDRLAEPVLGFYRIDGPRSEAVDRRHPHPEARVRAHLPDVHDRGVPADEGDHRAGCRIRADRSAVQRAGLSRARRCGRLWTGASGQVRPRIGRPARGRPCERREGAAGFGRFGVWRPPRALRAQLLRQPRERRYRVRQREPSLPQARSTSATRVAAVADGVGQRATQSSQMAARHQSLLQHELADQRSATLRHRGCATALAPRDVIPAEQFGGTNRHRTSPPGAQCAPCPPRLR
jgi:hypothetical protein